MTTLTAQHQLADGNNNAGGLQLFTAITDSNSVPFPMPSMKGSRNRGVKRVRLDGTQGIVGKDSVILTFGGLTLAQYDLLKDTYEGLITIRLPLEVVTYANYNAVMVVPDEADLEYRRGIRYPTWLGQTWSGYGPVPVVIRKLEAL
jgi:hypothetical protein